MIQDAKTGIIRSTITPLTPGERIGMDVFLPRDCCRITGIIVDVSLGAFAQNFLGTTSWGNNQAGQLTLRWLGVGDIVLQQKVEIPRTFEQDHTPMGINIDYRVPGSAGLWNVGKRFSPLSIPLENPGSLLRLYYKDSINVTIGKSENYTVTIFLYYQKRIEI